MLSGSRLPPILSLIVLGVAGLNARNLPADSTSPAGGYASQTNPLAAQLIKTGLYVISGATNSVVRLSGNGAIIVDGQTPDRCSALRQHIKKLSELPARLLITTDHHDEHNACNAQFAADGVQIVAHEHAAARLTSASVAPGTRPHRTYGDHLNLTLGGVSVRLMHFGNAHTDGDTVAYFPDLKVVAVGDLFAMSLDPDFASGGSLVGWPAVLDEILRLDFDVVVPGRGPTVTRADVLALRDRIGGVVSQATLAVRHGASPDQLIAQLNRPSGGGALPLTEAQLRGFFDELSRRK